MNIGRRQLLHGAAGAVLTSAALGSPAEAATGPAPSGPYRNPAGPRCRVLVANDLSGDPDGLFATVHALLSSSAQVRAIVGALNTDDPDTQHSADDSRTKALELLNLMGLAGQVPAYAGSNIKLTDPATPQPSPGAQAIIDEAMRTDTTLPLYLASGGTLTDVASAYLLRPEIAEKLTLIWIGGGPYPDGGWEYNFIQDPIAAQVIFNNSPMPIWQVTRQAYAQCLVSDTELQLQVRPHGPIGRWLYEQLYDRIARWSGSVNLGEAYVLGDSPLVLLTALTGAYDPTGAGGTGTSSFELTYAPHLNSDGTYVQQTSGRQIRVYQTIDTRLMFGDFFAKLRLNYGG